MLIYFGIGFAILVLLQVVYREEYRRDPLSIWDMILVVAAYPLLLLIAGVLRLVDDE